MTGTPAGPVILRVRVVDDDGRPIADAQVLFDQAPVAMPDIAALTDGAGEVVLAAPAPGAYRLRAAAAGYADSTVGFAVDAASGDELSIEMTMTRSDDGG